MPHCDMELYERLLRKNAGSHTDGDGGSTPTPTPTSALAESNLHNMLLVANRLADYIDRYAAPMLECRPFPASRPWPTAFNNTAVQFIPGTNTGACRGIGLGDGVGGGSSG
ncbi:hypothetical protein DXG03_001111 [Asterophora parasitica]|uniref:SRR1-like domain-containing protein n=1 Tax=Asterophora parasitica TaxID=117018 RepID=A0A9P7KCQ7_9AGAR|nr:hypothetical protein DXG03_001111 [Asterophora parasitica]